MSAAPRWTWLVASLALLAAPLVLWWTQRDRAAAPASRTTATSTATSTATASAVPGLDPGRQDPPPAEPAIVAPAVPEPIPANDASDPALRSLATASIEQTLQLYRETMVYPLSSRPADGSNRHLTHWNRPISVGQPFAVDAAGREIQASATIDRVFAAPGQAISVRVTASYVASGSPAPVDEIGAELQWLDRQANEWVTVQAVPLRKPGGSSTGSPRDPGPSPEPHSATEAWVGSIVPSQVEALRAQPREVRIMAHVRVGEFARELGLDFSYAAVQPVIVHGIASDRVVDGSLELGLDAELRAAAPVAIKATLFAGDGTTAIAVFDDRYFPTRSGRQVIPIRWFGKILHDRKIDGPYRLAAIHGYVYRQDQTPDQLFFDGGDQALMTAAHSAAGFSADAYQSPEVAARIAHYEALRDAARAGRPPPPPPEPRPAQR